jgi:hypothetical protein
MEGAGQRNGGNPEITVLTGVPVEKLHFSQNNRNLGVENV